MISEVAVVFSKNIRTNQNHRLLFIVTLIAYFHRSHDTPWSSAIVA